MGKHLFIGGPFAFTYLEFTSSNLSIKAQKCKPSRSNIFIGKSCFKAVYMVFSAFNPTIIVKLLGKPLYGAKWLANEGSKGYF
jgi:hypothetical protein